MINDTAGAEYVPFDSAVFSQCLFYILFVTISEKPLSRPSMSIVVSTK